MDALGEIELMLTAELFSKLIRLFCINIAYQRIPLDFFIYTYVYLKTII